MMTYLRDDLLAQNVILNNFVIENFSLKSLVLKILVMVTDGHTDGRTDIRTDRPSYRDARTHLKNGGGLNDVVTHCIIGKPCHQIIFLPQNSRFSYFENKMAPMVRWVDGKMEGRTNSQIDRQIDMTCYKDVKSHL